MLAIRDEQLVTLGLQQLGELPRELRDHLVSRLPSACAALGGAHEVDAFIERNLPTALRLGLVSAAAFAQLFELLLQFGPALERSPVRAWSTNILEHPVIAGDLKVDMLWERHHVLTDGRPVVSA
ncbi:MAG: hypothetical protein IAG13_29205 [Deltaproteobacteria bacterium]|nr:hypothetical protein [Nannocystaceae bacterium]